MKQCRNVPYDLAMVQSSFAPGGNGCYFYNRFERQFTVQNEGEVEVRTTERFGLRAWDGANFDNAGILPTIRAADRNPRMQMLACASSALDVEDFVTLDLKRFVRYSG